jgi:hypothetical protein
LSSAPSASVDCGAGIEKRGGKNFKIEYIADYRKAVSHNHFVPRLVELAKRNEK